MIQIELQKTLDSAEGEMKFDVNFEIANGTFVALTGPSGAGKTSLLRMVAGLLKPENGRVQVDSEVWFDSYAKTDIEARKRSIGFVFQDYALFPNMTVLGNLKFALPKDGDPAIIHHLLDLMELGQLSNSRPEKLSGGQRQRVALARALVRKPSILLLDEPLASLDNQMRGKMQKMLRNAHDEFGLTTLMVSHDAAEIYKLADRVLMMDSGKIANDNINDVVPSGEFELTAQILRIEQTGGECILTLQALNQTIKLVVAPVYTSSLAVGDTVMVTVKEFSSTIVKIGS